MTPFYFYAEASFCDFTSKIKLLLMELFVKRSKFDDSAPRERGATAIEYALIAALIAIVAIAAFQVVGQRMSGKFSDIAEEL